MEFIGYIFLPAFVAGIIQGVTGFGAGVVMMMFLPLQFSVIQSAGISSAICMILCAAMVYRYRKTINYKKIIGPAVLYLAISSISILFAKMINQEMMKIILGIFLIVLAIYFLFFSKKDIEPKGIVTLLCIVISGICDGLFGIGGPLMVIYFLSKTHSKEEYLGTIQCFFFINVLYSTIFRIINGIITIDLMSGIGLGMIGILIGLMIANKIVDKLDAHLIRKLTYVLIGLCGLSNIITTLL
ncbi:MAG: sulfite exporter TauE/SafE family protein [Faecalibacillus sp.]